MNRLADAWPCISLKEPWLCAVLMLDKRIENRPWYTTHRGPIWLHRSTTWTPTYVGKALEWMKDRGLDYCKAAVSSLRSSPDVPVGGLAGYTEIDGVLPPTDGLLSSLAIKTAADQMASFRANVPDADQMLRWKMDDQYGFVLKNTCRIDFVKVPGRQRWFYLPAAIERRARALLPEALRPF